MAVLDGLVVLVTGAGRGVGRAISFAVAESGAAVACLARTAPEIERTADDIRAAGGKALPVTADACDRQQVERAVEQVADDLGPVDVLINNAGSFYALGPVAEVDPEAWWRDVSINLLGTFLPTRAVLPGMLERNSGIVITMTGGGAAGPLANGTGYASSKAAVLRFTDCLAAELADTDVHTYVMSPGFVRTSLTEHHVFSEAGRKYLPMMEGSFDGEKQYPPDKAAALAVRLCRLRCKALCGRHVGPDDDVDALERDAGRIAEADALVLRTRPWTP